VSAPDVLHVLCLSCHGGPCSSSPLTSSDAAGGVSPDSAVYTLDEYFGILGGEVDGDEREIMQESSIVPNIAVLIPYGKGDM
jgi:hypothetical protein